MTREEFIKYLENTGLDFDANPKNFAEGYDGIYVFGKESKLRKANPKKYRNLFVPYVRVSGFNEDRWYVRNCGIVYYATQKEVMELVEDLKAVH